MNVEAGAGQARPSGEVLVPEDAKAGASRPRRLSLDYELVRLWLRDVILPIVTIRLGMMIFGFFAVAMFAPPTLAQGITGIWNHWDGPNFIGVANGGYGPQTRNPEWIAFFPLYPATIVLGKVLFSALDAAMLSSLIATLFAGLGIYELVRLDASRGQARQVVLAMILYPTAYTLVAPYSEALFLATSIWAFVAVRRNHMAAAGVLGCLAALTRIQGVFLIPALFVEYLMVRRKLSLDVVWIAFVALGPLIYLGLNWYYFGDPMHFMTVQQQVYNDHNQMPIITLHNVWNGVVNAKPADQNERWVMLYVAVLASYVMLALATIWATFSKHSRPSYAIYAAISTLSFATLSWPISVPRYVMATFPVFMALGSWSRWPGGQAVTVVSTLVLGAFMTLFLMGHWAF